MEIYLALSLSHGRAARHCIRGALNDLEYETKIAEIAPTPHCNWYVARDRHRNRLCGLLGSHGRFHRALIPW